MGALVIAFSRCASVIRMLLANTNPQLRNISFWHLADITLAAWNVRSWHLADNLINLTGNPAPCTQLSAGECATALR